MSATSILLSIDNSSVANFSAWASVISAQLATWGWIQSNDTGQVMWTGMSISACSMSGTTATFTYSGLTGLPLQNGRALNITGMTNAGNNKTVVVTSFTGTTSGTIVGTLATGVTESGSSGAVTATSTTPASSSFFYEVWQPGDSLTNFFLKLEYGNSTASTNAPGFRLTLSSTTNGAGTATGLVMGPTTPASTSNGGNGTSLFPMFMSGGSGRISIFAQGISGMICIGRSVNSSGADVGTHVSLWTYGSRGTNNPNIFGQTLVFGVGATTQMGGTLTNGGHGWGGPSFAQLTSTAFNGSVALSLATPLVGFFDNPSTLCGLCAVNDVLPLVPFQATVYGSTRTYLPIGLSCDTNSATIVMRYD